MLPALAHAWRHWHRPLMAFTVAMAALAVFSLGGLFLDDRTVVGDPVWMKPLKFALSFIAYSLSAAWLLSRLPAAKARRGHRLGSALALISAVEMVLIVGQAARGRRSHFNGETVLDAVAFQAMGALAGLIWLVSLAIAVLTLRKRMPDRALGLALRAGFGLALVGMILAVHMTAAPGQADPATDSLGAHTVGAPDGGSGMPVIGWSLEGGDMRIPHFLGLHALQLLPLLLWVLDLLAPRWPRLREATVRHRLVRTAAVAASGALALVTWQALRGQPLLSPDAATLAAVAALAAVTGLLTWHALAGHRTLELDVLAGPDGEPGAVPAGPGRPASADDRHRDGIPPTRTLLPGSGAAHR